jgi:transketolase
MIFNERNIKIWSTIGSRATFGITALELAKEIDNLMVLTCDVSTSAGLDRYRKTNPEKYLDLGIAEQNLIGVAAGLASENFNVITTTFAPFQTIRCCEQIKVNIGYMKQKICMVGIASGLALGTLGFTHCCIEDVGILRAIPGITIISPADSLETVKAIQSAVKSQTSTYVRLTGVSNNPIVYEKDYDFEIGKSIKIVEGKDLTIFASGTMVYNSIQAAKILKKDNIHCTVINMHTIKPLDKQAVEEACKNSKLLVSVEEHNIIGGLGSAIAEYKSSIEKSPKLVILGVNDYYSKGGEYHFLQDQYGLTPNKIVNNILSNFKEIK